MARGQSHWLVKLYFFIVWSRLWWQKQDKDADALPVQPCYIDVSASRGYNASWKIHTGYCFLVKKCKNSVSLHTQSYRDQPTLYSYHTRRVLRTLMQSIGASNYCTRDWMRSVLHAPDPPPDTHTIRGHKEQTIMYPQTLPQLLSWTAGAELTCFASVCVCLW